jgi:hypothetical protein
LLDDAGAKVDRESDDVLGVVQIRERDRGIAMADGEDTRACDPIQRVRLDLRVHRQTRNAKQKYK